MERDRSWNAFRWFAFALMNMCAGLLGGITVYVFTTPVFIYSIDELGTHAKISVKNVGLKEAQWKELKIVTSEEILPKPKIYRAYWTDKKKTKINDLYKITHDGQHSNYTWKDYNKLDDFEQGEQFEFSLISSNPQKDFRIISYNYTAKAFVKAITFKTENETLTKFILIAFTIIILVFIVIIMIMSVITYKVLRSRSI